MENLKPFFWFVPLLPNCALARIWTGKKEKNITEVTGKHQPNLYPLTLRNPSDILRTAPMLSEQYKGQRTRGRTGRIPCLLNFR